MTARSELRSSLAEAITKAVAVQSDEVDRCGPPALVFRVPNVRGFRFECRPLSNPPNENWVGLMYRPVPGGGVRQAGAGMFKDGRWTNDRNRPLESDLLWTAIVDDQDG